MLSVFRPYFGRDSGLPDRAGRFSGRLLSGVRPVGLLVLPWLLAAGVSARPVFKIFLRQPGVYQVTYEDLRRAGLEADTVDSRGLSITQDGRQVPIWVADGGDGRFGSGDLIELVGERLAGHRSFYSEYTSLNVYRLELDHSGGRRMTSPAPPDAAFRPKEPAPLVVEEHMEVDRFMLRFIGRGAQAPEPWYWARLTHVDPEPFRHGVWLHRYRPDPRQPMSMKVHLQGWSTAGGALPDHRVEVLLNDQLVGSGEWDGEVARLIEIPAVPADLARSGENFVEVRVPRRRTASGTDMVIDEVILNWIEISYPRHALIDSRQVSFVLPDPGSRAQVRFTTAAGERLLVYGAEGSRFDGGNMAIEDSAEVTHHSFQPPAGESAFRVAMAGSLRSPLAVELDHPSNLRDATRRADYIIITHPRLSQAIEPLAAFHRRRGLEVEIVRVEQIFDEFNHSLLDPRAIRDFLSYAYHQWQRPAPRLVLLVGDASWAGRGGWSSYGMSTPLPEKAKTRRNLIPAGIYEGWAGPAASDNFFVSVDGEDSLPDMAIGRFPVTEPEEVAAIVDKTIRYATAAGVGPWRRNILWISDSNPDFQRRSDGVADAASARGFSALKVYPSVDDAGNEGHQDVLRQALDAGQLLVHFYGHGGRFIWRTGNTDHRKRRDLFTLDHLDQLAPAVNLPVLLSMTCYSAPFDHPTADSIGEKFLRLEGRGAVAVLAASWRVPPVIKLSELLIEELTSSPGTIGEAVMRAKHRVKTHGLAELYNLLGDPAIELAIPRHWLKIVARAEGESAWQIVATVPEEVRGNAQPRFGRGAQAIVDWLNDAGEVVGSEQLEVRSATIEAFSRQAGAGEVASVRVYVWNQDAGVDGMGALRLQGAPGG